MLLFPLLLHFENKNNLLAFFISALQQTTTEYNYTGICLWIDFAQNKQTKQNPP